MENELKSEKHFKAEEYKRNPTLCEFPHNKDEKAKTFAIQIQN